MEIDLDLKVKLFKEYLDNGGIDKIDFPELLDAIMNAKSLPNGKTDPNTISPILNSAMLAYFETQIIEPFNSDEYLTNYTTLLQKSIFFTQVKIDTEKEFDEIFEKFVKSENILFRGLSEAKYRLYSSLQREWINSKLNNKHSSYEIFIKSLIDNARIEEKNSLSNYLDKIGIDSQNDLAVLSFLQHYGCPTPLLDWTYSFPNALFFATENLKEPEGKWEINRYFCVYYLEEEFFENASLQNIFIEGLKNQKFKLKNELIQSFKKCGIIYKLIVKVLTPQIIETIFYMQHGKQLMTYITKIEKLFKIPLLYFSDEKTDANLKYNLNTNMNIINQNGVFTWNSNPIKPIEHIQFEKAKENGKDGNILFSKCININKDLGDYVRRRITELGVNKDYIYPDAIEIAKKVFNKTK